MKGRVYTHDLQIIKQPCQQFCLILRPKTAQTCNASGAAQKNHYQVAVAKQCFSITLRLFYIRH